MTEKPISEVPMKHLVDDITRHYGYAEPILAIAAIVAWQARHYGKEKQERIAAAFKLIAEGGEMLKRLEEEEANER